MSETAEEIDINRRKRFLTKEEESGVKSLLTFFYDQFADQKPETTYRGKPKPSEKPSMDQIPSIGKILKSFIPGEGNEVNMWQYLVGVNRLNVSSRRQSPLYGPDYEPKDGRHEYEVSFRRWGIPFEKNQAQKIILYRRKGGRFGGLDHLATMNYTPRVGKGENMKPARLEILHEPGHRLVGEYSKPLCRVLQIYREVLPSN